MSNHAYDDILNYVVDQIQKLAPDEQEWLLDNLIDLVRERITNANEPTHSLLELEGLGAELWKESYSEILYEEALHYVKRLKREDQLELFKFLAGSVLQKARIGPQHNVMEFRGAAKDFWQGVDVEKYIEEERNSWE